VVDNVTLQVDNVPEPSTIALLTLGGLSALVGIRRRA
jgi:PEP-CTERM motif